MERRGFLKMVANAAGTGVGISALSKKLNAKPSKAKTNTTYWYPNPDNQYKIYRSINADAVLEFAAEELQKYIEKMTGVIISINTSVLGKPNCIVLSPSSPAGWETIAESAAQLKEDGFRLKSSQDLVIMAGSNSRGTLYAMYAFLEWMGCRFLIPGPEGDIIPAIYDVPAIPVDDVVEEPTFRRRDITEDWRYAFTVKGDPNPKHMEYWEKLIDWMGKNRINCTEGDEYMTLFKEHFKKRGITHWGGGHVIPKLLPHDLYDSNPDYFRMDQAGERVTNGNFCSSNKNALELACQNAVTLLDKNPDWENLNIWGEDVLSGSWCHCSDCSDLTPVDQYLTICNAIAEAVEKSGKNVEVECIAYHDSVSPDTSVTPHPNLRLLWAPRERAYRWSHDDPDSELNRWHSKHLKSWQEMVGGRNIDFFEYWGDCLLFRSYPMSIPHVLAGDLRYYHSLGAENWAIFLKLGDYMWQAQPLNGYVYARLTYNIDEDVDELVRDFFRHFYKTASSNMLKWHDSLFSGMKLTSQWGDVQLVPTTGGNMMDKYAEDIQLCQKLIKDAKQHLTKAANEEFDPAVKKRIKTAEWITDFAEIQVNGLYHQLKGSSMLSVTRTTALLAGAIEKMMPGGENPFLPTVKPLAKETEGHLKKAMSIYQEAINFTKNLPESEQTVWIQSETAGFVGLQRWAFLAISEQIKSCQEIING